MVRRFGAYLHMRMCAHHHHLQVCRLRFWGRFHNYQVGSGFLSVMGTSFTFLPIAQAAISQMVSKQCASQARLQ